MTTVARRLPLTVAALLMLCSSARADPLVVSRGTINIPSRFGSAEFTLEGEGFFLSAGVEQFVGELTCFPCGVGRLITIGGPLSGFQGGEPGTFNNVSYPALYFAGVMTVTSPPFPGSMLLQSLIVSEPFDFTAHISGFLTPNPDFSNEVPIFVENFVGRGTVTAQFHVQPVEPSIPLFIFANATFDFNAASPVPEPATIVLVGTGAAALLRRNWRRRYRHLRL